MSPSKREYERRRYEKWQQRQAAREARRRRQRALIAAGVVGVLVVGVGVAAALVTLGGSDDATPAADASTPASDALAPDPALAEGRAWTGSLRTSQGDVAFELDGASAPQAVANFVSLAQDSFFDSTACHRLVTTGIHVLQCGDPTGTGTGGPGYTWGPIENAPADDVYPAGTIAMARVGGDGASMGSQFFLVYEDSTIPSDAAGGYTVFGRITSGLDVVQAIADAGNGSDGVAPALDVIIEGVETQ
ncbi:peptidylprolyl isomerase [Cellulomonas chengniuliangii]|uniref:peptidylprolyl isomerase n=1 Tax=Cellulomonas chengniuliangii TaxID=2968084 RepID=UPI001D0E37AA|nr:peptidylprolyl isomerase [Cellulomonas chengniuliangii]MCC2317402.1 peptidylprolyl isomerase [Cellulomonas chengniuliangii]